MLLLQRAEPPRRYALMPERYDAAMRVSARRAQMRDGARGALFMIVSLFCLRYDMPPFAIATRWLMLITPPRAVRLLLPFADDDNINDARWRLTP